MILPSQHHILPFLNMLCSGATRLPISAVVSLSIKVLQCVSIALHPSGLLFTFHVFYYDTLFELVTQQVCHDKSADGSRLLPKLILLLWFQLSVFDFCLLHSICSFQCSDAEDFTSKYWFRFSAFSRGLFTPLLISRKTRWFEPLFLKVYYLC